jgi:type IV secretory pathway TrbF-like protein
MVEQKATIQESDTVIKNPYFTNQKGFQDRLDSERANTATWKHIAWFSSLITLVCVCGVIYLGQLPNVVPFIFKQDGSGGLTALGISNQEMKVNNQMIANQLSIFMISLRQVPVSNDIRSQHVQRVSLMSTPTAFNNILAPMLKQTYVEAGNKEIIVTIKNIFPIQNKSWEVDWSETENGLPRGTYKATLTIERSSDFKSSEAMVFNPLGLVVTDININKQLGS